MNRFAAPILFALAIAISGSAIAAPLSTNTEVSAFFQQQKLNGN